MNNARTQTAGKRSERGYALLLVIFLVTVLLISTMAIAPNILTEGQREKEKEMIWRGKQYTRGVKLYYRKMGRFPTALDDLTKPKVGSLRFMRQAYKDPMNKEDGSWRFIYVGPAGQLIGSLKPRQNLQLPQAAGIGTPANALNGPGNPGQPGALGQTGGIGQPSTGGQLPRQPEIPSALTKAMARRIRLRFLRGTRQRSSAATLSVWAARSTSPPSSSTTKPRTIACLNSFGIPRKTISELGNRACRRERDWASLLASNQGKIPSILSRIHLRIPSALNRIRRRTLSRHLKILNSRLRVRSRRSNFYSDCGARGGEVGGEATDCAGGFWGVLDLFLS